VEEARGFDASAVAIGVFDGVHAGHQRLLCATMETARELNGAPTVLTFDPHPACVVAPQRAPRMLYRVEERCELLGALGIRQILVLPFTAELARLSPERFVREVLMGAARAVAVVVGRGFRFGHKQAGSEDTLCELGRGLGFQTRVVEPASIRGRVVSASDIRQSIEGGAVGPAARLLGRFYGLSGEVVRGHGIGSRRTVPTLNLETPAEVLPGRGVYITRTTSLEDGRVWTSITNIGIRPTFGGDAESSIETHLLQPLADAAPARIRVEFLRRVRDERKFENAEALKAQILRDAGRARAYFRRVRKWVG
jgi:riboflavin kinase/FMN adenylyltransferase